MGGNRSIHGTACGHGIAIACILVKSSANHHTGRVTAFGIGLYCFIAGVVRIQPDQAGNPLCLRDGKAGIFAPGNSGTAFFGKINLVSQEKGTTAFRETVV